MNTKLPKKRYILRLPVASSGGGSPVASRGAWISQGNWNGASNAFPILGRLSDPIKEGYTWDNIANSTTLVKDDGGIIPAGATIRATTDAPGQTLVNWKITIG